jgi:hypothetical protein
VLTLGRNDQHAAITTGDGLTVVLVDSWPSLVARGEEISQRRTLTRINDFGDVQAGSSFRQRLGQTEPTCQHWY